MDIIQLEIDQVLHGYNDGHRMLATSMEINKEANRTMLVMSDMSGPSMQDGFEEYITGYPLPNSKIYVFSKTWFAPEMSRPGCVWTHTLLLPSEILYVLEDLSVLLPLFRQPNNELDFSIFKLKIKHQIQLSSKAKTSTHPLTSAIFYSLYGYDKDFPIALTFNTPLELEKTVVAIWSQQWPLLRNRFTFCSGAIAVRSLNGTPFNLQIIPSNQRKQFEKDVKNLHFVDKLETINSQESWINTLVEDIQETQNTHLRMFLRSFGGIEHHIVKKLTIFYNEFNSSSFNSKTARRVIDLFYRLFPKVNVSDPDFVRCILGQTIDESKRNFFSFTESDMLFDLATYREENVLNKKHINAKNRIMKFFIENKK